MTTAGSKTTCEGAAAWVVNWRPTLLCWRFDARSAIGGIDVVVVARRFREIGGGSGETAIWDDRTTYSWWLSGSTALCRGRVVPIIDGIQQYVRRQTKQKYRRLGKLQAAAVDFN